jgi:hypothetical protein
MDKNGKFYGFELKHTVNETDVTRGYTSVKEFESKTNTPYYECAKKNPVKIQEGFYGIGIEVKFLFYYVDKLNSQTIDKFTFSGVYHYSVKVDDSVLNDVFSVEWTKCFSSLVKDAFINLKNYTNGQGNVSDPFVIPSDEEVDLLVKNLEISNQQ